VEGNTIFHGKKTPIPMVANIRIGVVLDQTSLKQDASGVSVNFLLPPWAKQDCNNIYRLEKGKENQSSICRQCLAASMI